MCCLATSQRSRNHRFSISACLRGTPSKPLSMRSHFLELIPFPTIACPALTLAQKDAERGALDAGNLEVVRSTVEHLFADIAHEHRLLTKETGLAKEGRAASLPIIAKNQLASHWLAERPLVSMGVRSSLDEAAAEVIATLARTHGVELHVEKPGALSAAQLANLDLSGAALVCLSCLNTRTPAHIHYAARRVKNKAPHAKLLLGLWNATDDKELESLRQAAGADYAVKSFHEAAVIIQREATGARSHQCSEASQNPVELSARPTAPA